MSKKEIFDFSTVDDFDKHINLSIPNYSGLVDIFTALTLEYLHPEGVCIDIGCSTGHFLHQLPKINAQYVGVDLVRFEENYYDYFQFHQKDITEVLRKFSIVDVIVSMFTLQFLGKHKRAEVLEELKDLIDTGSVLLLAEKVYIADSKVNHTLHREHIKHKRKGFTSDDILDKDYQLLGKMYCNTTEQMKAELDYLGTATQVWQSFNFNAYIVQR
jgi:tRNA (cmo5U34)-methyltransferase